MSAQTVMATHLDPKWTNIELTDVAILSAMLLALLQVYNLQTTFIQQDNGADNYLQR